MEDAHTILPDFLDPDTSFIGVYDGHGGADVAHFCAKEIHTLLKANDSLRTDADSALRETFLAVDAKLRESDLQTDLMGTTAAVALITPTEVLAAGVGDTRVIAAAGGAAFPLTNDHKPVVTGERTRIEAAGGIVILGRTNGTLAISRAIGDFAMKSIDHDQKEQCVTPDPEISRHTASNVDFVLTACDGVWDVLSNDQAVAFVYEQLGKQVHPEEIVIRLAAQCIVSRDNVTAVLAVCKERYPWLSKSEPPTLNKEAAWKTVDAALCEQQVFYLPPVAGDGDATAETASAWASAPPPIPDEAQQDPPPPPTADDDERVVDAVSVTDPPPSE